MAPFITNYTSRFHPSFSHLSARLLSVYEKTHKLHNILSHKLPPVVLKNLKAREFVPISFYHPWDDMGPGPESASLPSNTDNVAGPPGHHFYQSSLDHLNIWAYLALAFVILAVVAVTSYVIYTCYHTAGLRVRPKPVVTVGAGADVGGVKGGWQTLEDRGHGGEMVVEGDESRLTKDRDVGEKVHDYRDENNQDGILNPWRQRKGLGLKGLGIQLHGSSKVQCDFTSHPNESQASILPGSPHSTCSDRASTSDHEHEQDLESSEDCHSLNAQPLAHTTERSATYLSFHLPLPLPLPPPVTPSPSQKQQVKQKRTRLRALTQILSHNNLTQNQNGRETYFELQPMITAGKGVDGQFKFDKGLSVSQDEPSPPSPSPLSSRSKSSPIQFGFFAPYPNCNSTSNSTYNSNSNATFGSGSWGNNSCSPATFSTTPITPLTPITPVTPVTPIKPAGPTATAAAVATELQFDSNNIQFVETPVRNSDGSPGSSSGGASPPEIHGAFAVGSINSLTRAEMLWNNPKLSPVQGAFGVGVGVGLGLSLGGGEKISTVTSIGPTDIVLAKTRAAAIPSKLKIPTTSIWQQTQDVSVPTLSTPDQVHRGPYAKLRRDHLRRGSVPPSSPPSPSPSFVSSNSSLNSAASSPSIATARFILDREGLKKDNLRNRDRAGLNREKGREKENMKPLSPIPRPVFLPHPQLQPSRLRSGQSF